MIGHGLFDKFTKYSMSQIKRITHLETNIWENQLYATEWQIQCFVFMSLVGIALRWDRETLGWVKHVKGQENM